MVEFIKSAIKVNDYPNTSKEVVFVGRSNAGKSSLINAIYNKKLAFEGKTPGKTRLINFYDVDGIYTAVDVPGYGFANRSYDEAIVFGEMMEEYFSRKKVKLVIIIVDSRLGLTKDDIDMLNFIKDKHIRYIIAANKIDKLSNNELNNNKNKLFKDYEYVYYVSALKKTNIDLLKKVINDNL